MDEGAKRLSVKQTCPNPLFEKWLKEWWIEAKTSGVKSQYTYKNALASLRKYPLPLNTGRECKILKWFGDKLCEKLEKKLLEHQRNADPNAVLQFPEDTGGDVQTETGKNKIKARKRRNRGEYVPVNRTGAYAIIVTLYRKSLEPDYVGYMSKIDIISEGRHLCDKSFIKPDPVSFLTAWSSMETLLQKNLVQSAGNPARFSLTDEGLILGRKLNDKISAAQGSSNDRLNDPISNSVATASVNRNVESAPKVPVECQPSSSKSTGAIKRTITTCSTSSAASEQEEMFIFAPNTFDVILLVDVMETRGKAAQNDPLKAELARLQVSYEVRHLKVGDYTWIARERTTGKELVLPYIIERKRMDDLAGSIKDGRFHEQKFRLKKSGIQNLIYLVESIGDNNRAGLPITTLHQATVNTLIIDGFSVKYTRSLKGTAEYLESMTTILGRMYTTKTIMSCRKSELSKSSIEDDLVPLMTFHEFNKAASKNKALTVREIFTKQLLQIKGMSVDRALAVVEKYPTPKLLMMAYTECGGAGEELLSSIEYGKLRRKIGPVLSKIVYQLYTSNNF